MIKESINFTFKVTDAPVKAVKAFKEFEKSLSEVGKVFKEGGMGVTLKMKKDGYEVLKSLNIESGLITEALSAGVLVVVNPTQIKFMSGFKTLASVQYKNGTLALVGKGALGSASLGYLQKQVKMSLKKSLVAIVGVQKESELAVAVTKVKGGFLVGAVDITPPEKGIGYEGTKTGYIYGTKPNISNIPKSAPVVVPNDIKMMFDYKSVPLKDADTMYQPVQGTSSTSRYFFIGQGGGLKIALRANGHSLSFRVEGEIVKHKDILEEAGLMVFEKHASVHLSVTDKQLAQRTAGALLAGLGLHMETPFPNVALIYGKEV